jgi:hypothetical protein
MHPAIHSLMVACLENYKPQVSYVMPIHPFFDRQSFNLLEAFPALFHFPQIPLLHFSFDLFPALLVD